MQPPLVRLLIALLVVSVSSSKALPPPGPQPLPPTISEIWDKTDAVVYGTAVRIQIDATKSHSETYDSTFRIERCWKGDLTGDIRIEGGRDCGCYISAPFGMNQTYLVLLKKLPDRDAYAPAQIFIVRLPIGSAPHARHSGGSTNPFALFGGEPQQELVHYDEYPLEILEFAERKIGNETEANRIHDLRIGPILERARLEKEAAQKTKDETDFVTAATVEFETARKTENLASRKSLLLALKQRLKDRFDNGTQELKGKIFAELSVIDTLLANGIKTSRPHNQ